TGTDAGGYGKEWSFSSGNDNAVGDALAFAIAKADATIDVGGYTGVHDADAHGATGSATGVNGEDLGALLDLGASFSDVPGGTAHWTFAGNTNYLGASGDASIVITKADATTNVQGYAAACDGNPHTATGTAKGVKGEGLAGL